MKNTSNREALIIKWHSKNLTQTEIADKLGVTRQRVQQLEKRLGLKRDRIKGQNKTELVCSCCKKKFLSAKSNRKFCSRECFYKSRKVVLTPKEEAKRIEEKLLKNRTKSSWYYHNVFKKKKDWQRIVKERNIKYGPQSTNKQTTVR